MNPPAALTTSAIPRYLCRKTRMHPASLSEVMHCSCLAPCFLAAADQTQSCFLRRLGVLNPTAHLSLQFVRQIPRAGYQAIRSLAFWNPAHLCLVFRCRKGFARKKLADFQASTLASLCTLYWCPALFCWKFEMTKFPFQLCSPLPSAPDSLIWFLQTICLQELRPRRVYRLSGFESID